MRSEPWFLAERSEAWAGLLLTSRSDVTVRRQHRRDDREIDFLVSLQDGEGSSTRVFVVQVKGTESSDPKNWTELVSPLFRAADVYLPECVFVINVRDNRGVYAWIANPQTTSDVARLNLPDSPDFRPLDESALDAIIERVRAWYDAIPRERVPQASQ